MAERETCTWTGASGTTYTYYVYKLPFTFSENQDGNYIYCKPVDNKWRPIYIGQGDLGDRVSDNHHKADCIKENGTTHVHGHLNAKEADRKAEESDLLESYPQAYEPKGCNKKEGG